MQPPRSQEVVLRWARLIAGEGFDRGLQPVQWHTLRFLAAANRFSRTPKALTSWLDQTKGSVSQTIAALERKGLIQRRRDADDHRVVRLDLTAAGRAAVDSPPATMATRMLAHLPDSERDHFVAMIQAMVQGEFRASGGTPFGLCRSCRHFRSDQSSVGYRCALLDVMLDDDDADRFCVEQEAA